MVARPAFAVYSGKIAEVVEEFKYVKSIFITGCSSGFGLEAARYFLERDWSVIATMRVPNPELLPRSERLKILALDVADQASIERAVAEAGSVDVLVNNAGIGMAHTLEGLTIDAIRDVFETNTFGTMALTQAILPQFRQRRSGVIINVTSTVTLKSLPLLSIYTASKAAVNAFTECLALELEQFGIRVKLVLPGKSPTTRFGENARSRMSSAFPDEYTEYVENIWKEFFKPGLTTEAVDVAEAIWRAANDPLCPMRVPAGADALAVAAVV